MVDRVDTFVLWRPAFERDQRERNPVHIDVLRRKESRFRIYLVTHPSEPTAHHLFTQQLAAESADSENVRHTICVPALGQHRDRDDTSDLFARSSRLANRVDQLSERKGCLILRLALFGFD